MKFIIFLIIWTILAIIAGLSSVKFIKRHEKVYCLLVINGLYLLGVFWGYQILYLAQNP